MLTPEINERLTRVGPGTPMGELLRRYWHIVAPTAELDADPVKPVRLLPRWDVYARDDLDRRVEMNPLPCNWLQCMDNSLDPVHFEHLHAVFGNYVMKRLGRPDALHAARHLKIDFDQFEYGIYKR